MEIDLSRFRDTFFQEADEHLAEMESGLLRLDGHPDGELLNAIFRGAHSIKGASGTFGFEEVVRFTHAMESLLDGMRAQQVQVSRERIDLLLASLDVLRRLLDSVRGNSPAPEETERVVQQLLVAQSEGSISPDLAPQVRDADGIPRWQVRFCPGPNTLRQGMDPVLILRELSRLGEVRSVEVDSSNLPALADLESDRCYLAWQIVLATEASRQQVEDVFAFVEDSATVEIQREGEERPGVSQLANEAAARPVSGSEPATIRVSTAKVDQLIDLVGELVIAQSMATQILAAMDSFRVAALHEAFGEVERYTRELQERLMGIRMTPVGQVFNRLPRLVHDLAAATGKEIALEIKGEETELDKSVVERLADPLMHLIRNAADHGIEPSPERLAAGKPAAGTIRLNASHQGGSVVLEISDDGRGLDLERILAKAVDRGIVETPEALSEERIYSLIFEPGFSTARTVTDISGRGVGLDVVKRSVDRLNGTISVHSRRGQGVTFRIKLPLTLAILDGLLLRVGRERYVLPLISIMESIAPGHEQLRNIAGKGEMIVLRGEPLPLVRLNRLLQVPGEPVTGPNALAVIVEHHGKRLALLVDELLGQQQVVIKSLEAHFRRVEGALGATILGDGQPALILDVAAIAEMARAAGAAAA